MLFSCKISHSLISYLDRRGEDLELLYEKCDWPTEFLRDPSCWLEADKMEALLRMMETEYARALTVNSPEAGRDALIVEVGHQCKDLRSWGVLDSVLRMVQTSKDLFAQPERFLSYFVSPAPPVGDMRRQPDSVSFVLPVSEMQFPLVTAYLRSALEALPTYINKPMASVTWQESRVSIAWSERQVSLFSEAENKELSLHPELVRNILMNLESSQTELEQAKKSLIERDLEIERLKKALSKQMSRVAPQPTLTERTLSAVEMLAAQVRAQPPLPVDNAGPSGSSHESGHESGHESSPVAEQGPKISLGASASMATHVGIGNSADVGIGNSADVGIGNSADVDLSALARALGQEIEKPVTDLLNELYRAGDYMARGQQLITLLIGQGRQTPQVQEAMRRVDWTHVSQEGPRLIKRVIRSLQGLQETSHDLHVLADLKRATSTQTNAELLLQRVPSDLNRLVERAIANVSARDSRLQAGHVSIDCQLSLTQDVAVLPIRMEQAVTNLLSNSLESMQPGGRIQIFTRPRGGRAEIEISDDGKGWDETSVAFFNSPMSESSDLLFAKSAHPAPRLGLALAQSIIRLHEGAVRVTTSAGSGAKILVDLPFA